MFIDKKVLTRLASIFFLMFALTACTEQDAHDHTLAEQVADGSTVTEYTCSMHPSVRSTDPNDTCPICGMDLIPIENEGVEVSESAEFTEFSPRAVSLMRVQSSPVIQGVAKEMVELQGRAQWDTRHIKTLTAWSAGRIETLHVDEVGEQVNAGDRVASLYSPELLSAQQEYLDAVQLLENRQLSPTLRSSAQETLRASAQRLQWLGIPQSDIERLVAERNQEDAVAIYAAMSGVVIDALVAVGEYVERGAPIARIADPEHVWVELDVFPNQVAYLSEGQKVVVNSVGLAEPLMGTVTLLEPEFDDSRQVVTARVEFEIGASQLLTGAFVNAQLEYEQQDQVLIPKSAVMYTGERSWVYVQNPENEYQFAGKEVQIGKSFGDYYEVKAGLKPGDLVVTQGNFRLDSELQLRGQASMMSGRQHQEHQHSELVDESSMENMPNHNAATEIISDENLEVILTHYFAQWDALKSDDLQSWKSAAENYMAAVDAVDWSEQMSEIRAQATRGQQHVMHVSDLQTARDHFYFYSLAWIQIARKQGTSIEAHVAYCPMARSGAGAEWLQPNRELQNPYYGSMMLRCGEMREPLQHEAS
ncbi:MULTISPECIES: efflux RND transporter periplasmic adaptor subunit [Gammaproteobacteria]|uniref:efflux RND transporter periplasmic adaptor subunit n=1 Tax=Gammaproteobacteria TaxID=1236 RepID=UPI000DD0A64A|nr:MULTISPECIES: efflux RND transporter periplasmic adaptor subunit [Gammaproteobacteria]RTE86276.1 efflux RND transporter periplasmic adaptor subunit [Aliidiomarina sp. B3213]TCZ91627.1 efflux RND transporter periplasmic adaptor subunit [Lysobacter sp. N42]